MLPILLAPVAAISAVAAAPTTARVDLLPPVAQEAGSKGAALPVAGEATADHPASTAGADSPVRAKRHHHTKGDPLEGFNRAMFGIHQGFDHALLRPAAMGYKTVVPKPLRSGFRNILRNLTEPIVFVNFLLQGKPGKAGETLARFAVNTTMGWGGLFDLAKRPAFKLPHHDNGFGTTLAIYGVKPGPYLFLPLIGPGTLRDMVGNGADSAVLPTAVGKPFNTWKYQLGTGVVGGLDQRAEADEDLKVLFADAIDPYATLRSVYLQDRAAQIEEIRGHRSQLPAKTAADMPAPSASPEGTVELADPLTDPDAGPAAATPPPPPSAAMPTAAPQEPPQSSAPELRDPLEDPAAPVTQP